MIRLIQRRLIIPRGDTGSFSLPVLANKNTGDIAVFTIFDSLTKTRAFQKIIEIEGDVLTIAFSHNETVNLKPGKYFWDIKFYSNPQIVDDELVNGDEVDSYYAGFTMPACEIRETADNYLVSPDSPTATLSPEQLDIITGAINELNEAIRKTNENVEHYPEIRDEVWYVWDTELGDFVSTGVRANGIVGNGIASAILNDDYTLTLNFTDGTSYTSPSIRGNGIEDIVLNNDYTLTIIDTDGAAYTTPSIRGPVGATPNLTIGTVQEGPDAAATITGTPENPVLNLTLPNADVPTKISQLENDSDFTTNEKVDNLILVQDEQPTSEYNKIWIKETANSVQIPTVNDLPTKVSELENDADYAIDANYVHTDNNYTTAEKEKLSGIAAGAEANVNADWSAASGDAQILNKPTKVSDFTNDAGYLTTETDPTVPAWAKAANKPSYTAAEVGAPTVAEMNTAIGEAIGQINSFDMAVVQELPTQDISTHTIYLVPKTGETNDVYDEYVYINNNWEMIGNTQIDLSDYALKSELPTKVSELSNDSGYLTSYTETDPTVPQWAKANTKPSYTAAEVGALPSNTHIPSTTAELTNDAGFITSADLPTKVSDLTNDAGYLTQHQDISGKANSADLAAVAISGSYDDLINKPSIPSKVSDLTDDSGHYIKPSGGIPASDLAAGIIPTVPVQDVQVNGTSILDAQGVASVPVASDSSFGVTKGNINKGIGVDSVSKNLYISRASDSQVKAGTSAYKPITPVNQHTSTFYGLATAAGDATQSTSSNAVGTYTDAAKAAIQSMLGISQMLAPENPNLVATQAYAIGDVFTANGHLYKTTAAIAQDEAIIPDTNCVETTMVDESVRDVQVNGSSIVGSDGVANVPVASTSELGVVKIDDGYGISIASSSYGSPNALRINKAADSHVKAGNSDTRPIVTSNQHRATFYGLSKAAGVDLKNEEVTLGTYTPEAKGAIQSMLGVSDLIATAENSLVASKAYAIGDVFTANGKLYKATAAIAANDSIVLQNNGETVSGANAVEVKLGDYTVHDVQVDGTSIVNNGVVNIPVADNNTLGLIQIDSSYGITRAQNVVDNNLVTTNFLSIATATNNMIKLGQSNMRPITPINQHRSAFYGLAKAAGDTTQSQSNNAVGTYTDEAKAAIKSMIGVNVEDVQINGTSIVLNNVANIPKMTTTVVGVEKLANGGGLKIVTNGIAIDVATDAQIKTGTDNYRPIVPSKQQTSVFYGLAKAAGDITQSASSNAVGTYTDNAKASIKSMLGIVDGSTGTVDVSGTTPTIVAVENTRYVCGEVTSLDFTPAASGICIVRFTSGSTVTVLTLPSTVKFPEWFDPTSLETNTIYEICITDGVYGAVMSWAQ